MGQHTPHRNSQKPSWPMVRKCLACRKDFDVEENYFRCRRCRKMTDVGIMSASMHIRSSGRR